MKIQILSILLTLFLVSCGGDGGDVFVEPGFSETTEYTPLLMDRDEFESTFSVEGPREIHGHGKIYTKGNYIYIAKAYEGIHVINNTNPSSPVNEKFIVVMGIRDIAAKGDIIYANSSIDLLSIDLSDPNDIKIVNRGKNIFPEPYPPNMNSIPMKYSTANRPENTIIVKWIKKP